jgi:DNA mismatch endonuclease (patch repair protein)
MLAKPAASHPDVAKRMSRQRTADTEQELRVRRSLFAVGLRYRKNLTVPGFPRRSIDIAFPRRRLAVFLDGCFWHGCTEHKTMPKSNDRWWAAKINDNRLRDRETTAELEARGWIVLRFWEHEPIEAVVTAIIDALDKAAGKRSDG